MGDFYSLNTWIGIILVVSIHELGHAFLATVFNRYVEFGWYRFNPGVYHYIYEGERETSKSKHQIITSAGLIFNLVTFPFVLPLLDVPLWWYVIVNSGMSLSDIFHIIKRIREGDEG